MPTKELDVLIQHKDKDGNIEIHYPVTKAENVVGLDEEMEKINKKYAFVTNKDNQASQGYWFKYASGTIPYDYSHTYTFSVTQSHATNSFQGTLFFSLRQSHNDPVLSWSSFSDAARIEPTHFAALYRHSEDKKATDFELYCYIDIKYRAFRFDLLSSAIQVDASIPDITLYQTSGSGNGFMTLPGNFSVVYSNLAAAPSNHASNMTDHGVATNSIYGHVKVKSGNGLNISSGELSMSEASSSNAGAMTSAEKTKLFGIEQGAEKNKVNSVAGKTGAVTLADMGLDKVNNTSDKDKPISDAARTELDRKVSRVQISRVSRDYCDCVIALCDIDNSTIARDSFSTGRLFLKRFNGVNAMLRINVDMEKVYNQENASVKYEMIGGIAKSTCIPCKFKYNGGTYAGLRIFVADSSTTHAYFEGFTNFDIFGTLLSDLKTGEVLNQEIYDSLEEIEPHNFNYKYNGYDILHTGNTDFDDILKDYVEKESGKGLSQENYTSTEKTKLAGIAAGATTNSPYTSTPAMNGTGSAGSNASFARGDHVHPTDTSRAPTSHASTATTYGAATGTQYGHVMRADNTSTTDQNSYIPYHYTNAPGTVNLNDYRYQGDYTFYNITTANNFPTGTWTGTTYGSYLEVRRVYSSSHVVQRLHKRGTTEMWIRYSTTASSWGAWQQIVTGNHASSTTDFGIATTANYGHVKVTTGNGLALSSGTLSMTAGSTSAAGALQMVDSYSSASTTQPPTAKALRDGLAAKPASEEGKWTPVLNGGTNINTYGSGSYVKIGSMVYIQGMLLVTSFTGNSTVVTISGLPFTASSGFLDGQIYVSGKTLGDASKMINVFFLASGSAITPKYQTVYDHYTWKGSEFAVQNMTFSGCYNI